MIGEKLKELLKQRGMKQSELATMIGVSKQTINSIITRNNKAVDFSTMEKIADALDVPIEYFFDREPRSAKEQPFITERLSDKELEFIRDFSVLTPSNRRILFALSKILLQEQSGHPEDQD